MTKAQESDPLEDKLAAAWLTSGVRPHNRATLAALGDVREFAAGTVLMIEGDPTEFLGVLLDGRVGLRLRVPGRAPLTILTIEPGDVIGWSAVVPPYRATSTVVALTDSEIAYFDGPALRSALADDDALAAEFYPTLLSAVSRRLNGTRLQLLDLFGDPWVEPW